MGRICDALQGTITVPGGNYSKYFVQKIVNQKTGYQIVAFIPEKTVYADFNKTMRMTILICSIFTLIVVTATALITRKIMVPLKTIRNSIHSNADQIAKGKADLTRRISVKSKNEIGDVAESFNVFSGTLQDIIRTMKQAKTSLNNAGDAGKRFAVVADEIRKLSETSSTQSKTIGEQLNQIQATIETVVEATQRGVQGYTHLANEINETESMKLSMDEMGMSTGKINDSGKALSEISSLMKDSISEIGKQVDQFTV